MWKWLQPNDAKVLLKQQLADAKRDRAIHAAAAEEHVAWVNMLDARIARIESELQEVQS